MNTHLICIENLDRAALSPCVLSSQKVIELIQQGEKRVLVLWLFFFDSFTFTLFPLKTLSKGVCLFVF